MVEKGRTALKRSYGKMMRRSVYHGLTRFLSIFAIVALGCGFLVGLFSTCPDMQDTADDYYRQYHTMDLDIKGTAGLTDADLEALLTLSGAETAQAGYCMDLVVSDSSGEDVTARLWGFSEPAETRINGFTLTAGRMPQNASECVLELPNSYTSSYQVGEVFTISPETMPEGLVPQEVTVVGIASSPLYMSIEQETTTVGNGKIGLIFYMDVSAFALPAYTDILLTFSDTAAYNCFSDDYRDLLAEKQEEAEALGELRSEERYKECQAEYEQKISEAANTITLAESEFSERWAEAQKLLEGLKNAVSSAEASLAAKERGFLLLFGTEDAFSEEARQSLAAAEAEVTSKRDSYLAAVSVAEEQKTEVEEALAKAREELAQAEQDAESFAMPQWVIFARTDNVGYDSFYGNSVKVESISKIFPVFFCLVAALVAMTTMTRMVEEERTQAGVLGALGYGNGTILWYYVGYCLSACVPGCVAGVLIGSKLFPSVIWKAYHMMYALPPLQTSFRLGYALGAFLSVCGVILIATCLVCRSSLRETSASLMRPRAPTAGKRIFLEHIPLIWKRFSFNHKVTARNLFRYKKRLFMTIVGVAGCTALLLTGFGLRDSIGCIVDRQYDRVQTYELTVMLRDGSAWEEDAVLQAFSQEEQVNGVLPVHAESMTLYSEKEHFEVSLYVPLETEQFDDYLSLHTRRGSIPLSLDDGLILTEKAAQILGVSEGDSVRIVCGDDKEAVVTVGGICENYIQNFACISPDCYSALFGLASAPSALFVKLQEDTEEVRDAVAEKLYESDNVSYLHFNGAVRETFSRMIEKLNFVVYVLIFSAAALAIIVLYNLNNINICERRRELATIKVLGFYEKEVSEYIFRETFVLTLIGDAFGLLLGVLLHRFVVQTAEMDMVMFGRDISVWSFLLSALITVLFSVLAGLLSLPVLRKIDMVDSLKSNE